LTVTQHHGQRIVSIAKGIAFNHDWLANDTFDGKLAPIDFRFNSLDYCSAAAV
jgi:hypothetical protein